MPDIEVVATGLRFPEGPVAADGGVILVEIAAERIIRVRPDGKRLCAVETYTDRLATTRWPRPGLKLSHSA